MQGFLPFSKRLPVFSFSRKSPHSVSRLPKQLVIKRWISCHNSPCLSFPFLEISKERGFGTFSVHISSVRSVFTPKRAFLPTFMYCLPTTFGDPGPNKDVMNLIFDFGCGSRGEEERCYLELVLDRRKRSPN